METKLGQYENVNGKCNQKNFTVFFKQQRKWNKIFESVQQKACLDRWATLEGCFPNQRELCTYRRRSSFGFQPYASFCLLRLLCVYLQIDKFDKKITYTSHAWVECFRENLADHSLGIVTPTCILRKESNFCVKTILPGLTFLLDTLLTS